MKTKKITLSDGTKVEVNIIIYEDGSMGVDTDIQLTQEQADEIAEMIF